MASPLRPARPAPHWAVLLMATLTCSATEAFAASAWTMKGRGSSVYVETVSQIRGSRLVLDCQEVAKLYLYIPRGWDGTKLDSMFLAIDGVRIAVTADGVDAAVILSDRPNEVVGVTTSLLSRMKAGKKLVISGSATTRIPPEQLTFSLAGAASAITAFERGCPAARSARRSARFRPSRVCGA